MLLARESNPVERHHENNSQYIALIGVWAADVRFRHMLERALEVDSWLTSRIQQESLMELLLTADRSRLFESIEVEPMGCMCSAGSQLSHSQFPCYIKFELQWKKRREGLVLPRHNRENRSLGKLLSPLTSCVLVTITNLPSRRKLLSCFTHR